MSDFGRLLVSGWGRLVGDLFLWARETERGISPLVVAALVVVAVGAVVVAVVVAISRPGRELDELLEPYRVQGGGARRVPSLSATGAGSALVAAGAGEVVPAEPGSLVRRASDAVGRLADGGEFAKRLEATLARAGVPARPGEVLLGWGVGAIVLVGLGAGLVGPAGALLGLILATLGPLALLRATADRRTRQFQSELPGVLKLLAGSLRGGFSLLQGLDSLVGQVGEPMASEVALALSAIRVGVAPEDALGAVAERVGSQDFSWAVMAIRIQREVGGNLAEILDTVAETMLERERLRREVRTLTAEGRMSALILGLMPFLMGALVFMVNRPYMETLFATNGGRFALLGGVLLELLGVWWLYRLVQIDV